MRIWLMLWATWWLVLKSCQCFRDIVKHGYMYSSSCVVPIKIHAKVLLSVPVVQAPVVFAEDGSKMFGMFAAYIFYSKVIHTQRE